MGFLDIDPPAASRDAVLAGRRIFHITEPTTWRTATRAGTFTESTRGKSLADVGYIHCSFADQVVSVANVVYGDWDQELLLLEIDSTLVPSEIRIENLEGGSQRYPHIYGTVPVEAVVATRTMTKQSAGWVLPTDL